MGLEVGALGPAASQLPGVGVWGTQIRLSPSEGVSLSAYCVPGAVLGAETQPQRALQGLGGCQRSHVSCSSAGRGGHMLLL